MARDAGEPCEQGQACVFASAPNALGIVCSERLPESAMNQLLLVQLERGDLRTATRAARAWQTRDTQPPYYYELELEPPVS